MSNYDNSVIYNDSVVAGMMHYFDDKEAIIIYLSDHGLDIFQSGYFCGHGKLNNPKSKEAALKIPFMIYMSPKYQEKFPETAQRIRNSVGQPFNTGYIIHTIMDIIGVKFSDNEDVSKYTLLKPLHSS